MKWSTHLKITRVVCSALELDEEIIEASILPDKEPDRVMGKIVEHHGRAARELALKYLIKARKLFLRGNKKYTRYLGRALHYIQDCSVPPPMKVPFLRLKIYGTHESFEDEMDSVPIPVKAVIKGLREEIPPHKVRRRILELEPGRTPEGAVFRATYMTSLAVRAVVKPWKPPSLEEEYEIRLKRHLFLVMSVPASLLVIGALVPGMGLFPIMVLMPILTFLVHPRRYFFPRYFVRYGMVSLGLVFRPKNHFLTLCGIPRFSSIMSGEVVWRCGQGKYQLTQQ